MKFDFDQQKSIKNKSKHGISLEEAQALWFVTSVIIEAKTIDEPRFMIIGQIKGKFYSCVYTIRGNITRLISARRSRKSEEEIYHDHVKR